MKFAYEDQSQETRKPVAILYKFNGGPSMCLAVKAQSGKTVWFYEDSLPSIQDNGFSDAKGEVKRFYHGDKITITF